MSTKVELIKTNYIQKVAIGNLIMSMSKSLDSGTNCDSLWKVYRIVKQTQETFFWESIKVDSDLVLMQRCVLRLNHMLEKFLPRHDIEIAESEQVPVGKIKTTSTSGVVKLFYGWSSKSNLSESEIESSLNYQYVTTGGSFYIPFNVNQNFNYLWFSEPITEPVKTKWFETTNPLNNGDIGNPGDLFRTYIVGKYRVYVSDYKTKSEGLIQFKI